MNDITTLTPLKEPPGQSLFRASAQARSQGDRATGRRLTEQALRFDPAIGGAWFNLGTDYMLEGKHEAAEACFRRSVELLGEEPYALSNVGWSRYLQGDVHGGIAWTERSRKVTTSLPGPLNNLAHMYMGVRDHESGLSLAEQAIALDPGNPTYRVSRAFALLYNDEVSKGLREYESRFRFKLKEFENYPMPFWRGEKTGHLFIVGEQGIGDTIQFGRFIKRAGMYAERLTISVHPALVKLFTAEFDGLATIIGSPAPMPEADYYCPMMSLPVAMGLKDNEILEIGEEWTGRPIATTIQPDWLVPSRKLHVGIAWAGSPDMENNTNRSTVPEEFLALYDAPGIQLYSLQVGPEALPNKHAHLGNLIRDLSWEIRDVTDTMAIMEHLDAVVSVCTSVVHIAGAVGLPFAVLPPSRAPHWVWGYNDRSVWYPETAHVFRQRFGGDWRPAMEEAAQWLTTLK